MRIAIFTDSFLPGTGGTEQAVKRLATALSKTDEVMVCAPDYHTDFDDSAFPFKVARAKSLKLTSNDFWARPFYSRKFKEKLEEFKPEVIHCNHWGMMSGYANHYAKKHNIPVVYTIHTKFKYCFDYSFKLGFISNLIIKNSLRRLNRANLVTTVSNSMAEELKKYGCKKEIKVIRNGGEKLPVVNVNMDKAIKTKDFNFLFIGLVIKYKNIGFTLKALSLVKRVRSDFKFYVVGSGPSKGGFVRQAKRLGIEDNVIFTGRITDFCKKREILSKTDLLLFPSIFDSDGLVTLEAKAEGVPTLVLEGTGASERITDGVTGFTSKPTPEDFAKKILALISSPEKLVEVGSSQIPICKSWEEIASEYKIEYQKLVEQKLNKN